MCCFPPLLPTSQLVHAPVCPHLNHVDEEKSFGRASSRRYLQQWIVTHHQIPKWSVLSRNTCLQGKKLRESTNRFVSQAAFSSSAMGDSYLAVSTDIYSLGRFTDIFELSITEVRCAMLLRILQTRANGQDGRRPKSTRLLPSITRWSAPEAL